MIFKSTATRWTDVDGTLNYPTYETEIQNFAGVFVLHPCLHTGIHYRNYGSVCRILFLRLLSHYKEIICENILKQQMVCLSWTYRIKHSPSSTTTYSICMLYGRRGTRPTEYQSQKDMIFKWLLTTINTSALRSQFYANAMWISGQMRTRSPIMDISTFGIQILNHNYTYSHSNTDVYVSIDREMCKNKFDNYCTYSLS